MTPASLAPFRNRQAISLGAVPRLSAEELAEVIEVANADELLATEAYGAGALLRWESSAAEAGTYVEGGTEALVSGTTLYDVWDAAGIETTWYRTRVSDAAGTTFSAYSDARSPVRSDISASDFRSTCSGNGSSSTRPSMAGDSSRTSHSPSGSSGAVPLYRPGAPGSACSQTVAIRRPPAST